MTVALSSTRRFHPLHILNVFRNFRHKYRKPEKHSNQVQQQLIPMTQWVVSAILNIKWCECDNCKKGARNYKEEYPKDSIRSLRRNQCCVEVGPKTLAENRASIHRADLRWAVESQEETSSTNVHKEENVDVETKHILQKSLGGKRNGARILHFKFFGIFGAYEHWMLTFPASAGLPISMCLFDRFFIKRCGCNKADRKGLVRI